MTPDLFTRYVDSLNKTLALRKELIRKQFEKLCVVDTTTNEGKALLEELTNTANNTFAKGIDNYESGELFEGWKHRLKDGKFTPIK